MVSRTAEYMALFRSLESHRDPVGRWVVDPHAGEFLTGVRRVAATAGRHQWSAALIGRLVDRVWPGPRSSGVVRTRVIDEAVTAAVEAGIDQLVVVGAGFDTRAGRLASLRDVACFEVDLGETQQFKREQLRKVDPGTETRVVFVSADLAERDLGSVLVGEGLDAGRRVVFVWEGVTNYLDAGTVANTLRSMGRCSAPGGVVIFTYVDQRALRDPSPFPEAAAWAHRVAKAGEPFTYGIDPHELPGILEPAGLMLECDTSTADAAAEMSADLRPETGSDLYRVAIATVDRHDRLGSDAQDL